MSTDNDTIADVRKKVRLSGDAVRLESLTYGDSTAWG